MVCLCLALYREGAGAIGNIKNLEAELARFPLKRREKDETEVVCLQLADAARQRPLFEGDAENLAMGYHGCPWLLVGASPQRTLH